MAARGWGGSVATAVGVAAGTGAAQLGFGYGLGIIAWLPPAGGSSEAAWVASLTWATWIAATSTIAGAVCAHRLGGGARRSTGTAGGRQPALGGLLWRAVLAVSAAVGALVTVVLVAVPARAAVRADTSAPQTVAAGYAVLGVLLGLVAAIWAISSPAVAGNVLGTVCWLWALALISVVDGVLSGRGLAAAQLGVWQLTSDGERFWFREYFYWPGAALSLGSALLIGALVARSAARRPATRVGAVVSGIAGPLLVAVAYFVAAPRLVGIRPEQVSAHLMAPYAVVAGLAGSALVAALAQRAETMAAEPDAAAPGSGPGAAPGTGPASGTDSAPEAGPRPSGARPDTPPDVDPDIDLATEPATDPGAEPTGLARRSARLPGQPTGPVRRGTDETRASRHRRRAAAINDDGQDPGSDGGSTPPTAEPAATGGGPETNAGRPETSTGKSETSTAGRPESSAGKPETGDAEQPTSAVTAGASTSTGSAETTEPGGEGGTKGRLGRFGRRSR
ncbi:hypothetical protein O7626_34685 [Micromonospora sp. WMMD1102]|uniref:hypothetical protein n=1 Tax=Micromonospora sp. WMMD1102 TaxID=3016105 RepID=UPI0024152B14|nr:hypothetical protein [Micromonospora sp. WMMD1102]MDG4790996.1 hypothetical protein [Micromonospora sp. WMMD1102]